MADRSNARLNEKIESKIRQWDGTIFGASLKNMYEKQANETFKGLSITHQMLVFLHGSMITVGETYDYSGRYAKEKADKLLKGYEALELFGWFFEMDEEKQVLDGTSELFAPAEEK